MDRLMLHSKPEDEEEEEEEENWADTSWSEPKDSIATTSSKHDQGNAETLPTGGSTGNLSPGKNGEISKIAGAESQEGQSVDHVDNKGTGPSNSPELMSRMKLNDNKAGMEGLDRDRINKIIYEASKGSRYYENEMKKEKQVTVKINDQKSRLALLSPEQLHAGEKEADKILQQLEESRDLSRTIVHVDMDAFYAAVEMRDDPCLRNKPMAVGGNDMLSTSNYIARRFGVRAAMPGFIGKKLCPDLVLVKPNFEKYTAVSKEIREIFSDYDPHFCPMSLDEAYLDFTEHLEKRQTWDGDQRTYFVKVPEDGSSCQCSKQDNEYASQKCNTETDIYQVKDSKPEIRDLKKAVICGSCGKPVAHDVGEKVVFGKTVEDAVQEMRFRIQQKTLLTASAGIAPNTMLAKVCSDRNKPNGQFRIQPSIDSVLEFIAELPIRKISGIGKVSERLLAALSVVKCRDIHVKRGALFHLYSQTSFNYFLRISLGISSSHLERDSERKSMSVERTFSEINKPAELFKKCYQLCEALADDLKEESLQGRTVTLKLKTVAFEVKTRANSVLNYTNDMSAIYSAARELLKNEIQAVAPQPLRLRLMGVRMSNFPQGNQGTDQKQTSIKDLLNKLFCKSTSSNLNLDMSDNTEPDKTGTQTCLIRPEPASPMLCDSTGGEAKHTGGCDTSSGGQILAPFGAVFKAEGSSACVSTLKLDKKEIPKVDGEIAESNQVPKIAEEKKTTVYDNDASEPSFTNNNIINDKLEATYECSSQVQMQEISRVKHSEISIDNTNFTGKKGKKSRKSQPVSEEVNRESTSKAQTMEEKSLYTCPLCGIVMPNRNLIMLNSHIDKCLQSQNDGGSDCGKSENLGAGTLSSSPSKGIKIKDGSPVNISVNNASVELRNVGHQGNTDSPSHAKLTVDINKNSVCCDNKNMDEPETVSLTCCRESLGPIVTVTEGRYIPAELPEEFICPICNIEPSVSSLAEFNQHVDGCLTRRTIKELLRQDQTSQVTPLKRPADISTNEGQPTAKRKRPAGIKTIDSFFR